jgi:hypothetical protein
MTDIMKNGYYIRTYDRDIFISEYQKEILYAAMEGERKFFDIDDCRVMMSQVKEVVPSREYVKSPNGGYYCPKHNDNFIPKGKTCGYCR